MSDHQATEPVSRGPARRRVWRCIVAAPLAAAMLLSSTAVAVHADDKADTESDQSGPRTPSVDRDALMALSDATRL